MSELAKELAIERIKREMELNYKGFEKLEPDMAKYLCARKFVFDACRVLIADEDL